MFQLLKWRIRQKHVVCILISTFAFGLILRNWGFAIEGDLWGKNLLKENNKSINIGSEERKTLGVLPRILLVVQTTKKSPANHVVNIIFNFYKDVFGGVAFCSGEGIKFQSHNEKLQIFRIPRNKNAQIACLKKVKKANPYFEGFLVMEENLLLNWWTLIGLDDKKLWIGGSTLLHDEGERKFCLANNNYLKNKAQNHCKDIEMLKFIGKNSGIKTKHFMENTLNEMKYDERNCFRIHKEIFYLPHQNLTSFIKKLQTNPQRNITSTLLSMITNKYQYINSIELILGSKNTHNESQTKIMWEKYKLNYGFITPFSYNQRGFGAVLFGDIVKKYSRRVLDLVNTFC